MEFKNDVLIVGAGPTGLTLASVLTKHGLTVKIIDKQSGVSTATKATNLMQGCQEKLEIYGLLSPMYEEAGKMSRLMMYGYNRNLGPISYKRIEASYENVLLLGQQKIDGSLYESLKQSNINVLFETELIGLEQQTEFVTVTTKTSGKETSENFKYVVGCDGARSITRTYTNLNFKPISTGVTVRQVDAKLKWKRLNEIKQMWLFYFDTGFCAVIPLLDGITKFITFDSSKETPDRKPTLGEMQAKLREITGDDTATLTDPIWFSQGELLTGLAPALIDNRVILAGDSGNAILPNGGQGLNTGIQDSINLGWKLFDTVKHNANPILLKTYESERLSLRTSMEKAQNASLKYTLTPPKFMKWFVKNVGPFLLKKGGASAMIQAFSQLGINYKKSALTVEKLKTGGIKAGYSIKDADILFAKDNKDVSLFKILLKPTWKLIYFDNGTVIKKNIALEDFSVKFSFVNQYLISSSLKTNEDLDNLYFDIDEVAHKVYGIETPAFYLIRPDNYVAVRTSSLIDITEFLKTIYN